MPYFVRQPYAQRQAPQCTKTRSDEPDILALASSVLASAGGAEGRLRIREPLRPGEQGAMVLDLALEKGAPPLTVRLSASDLVEDNRRIGSDAIRIAPSILTVPARASAEVTVTVQAPLDAQPGLYTGTLSVAGDENFSASFQVQVR